ncbi:MAG: hypothetical protein IPP98_16570 [Gemmatimonadetes bacterium]|nr:hypothetical protein [Gemmatimonadota bacterium]
MSWRRLALVVVTALGGGANALSAQSSVRLTPMAQGVGVATSVDPIPSGGSLTEVRLVQPVAMALLSAAGGRLQGTLTLNFESITIPGGELTPGGWGEGFVDRRHPHTTVHELLLGTPDLLGTARRGTRLGLVAGKGFVPFGTDDPMVRPFLRYPVNHHLSQVLERAVVIGQVDHGPVTVEGALFNGDEPEHPSQWPLLRLPDGQWRFGDSRALRVTVRPLTGLELQGSVASILSPEHRPAAGGRAEKASASLRWQDAPSWGTRYLMAEWARTSELEGTFVFLSVLAEGSIRRGPWSAGYRFEATDRPEEERLLDPFRSLRPHLENSILGIGRWTLHTVRVARELRDPALPFRATPFIEATFGDVEKLDAGIFDPVRLYGGTSVRQLSIGVVVGWGMRHHRMGRYGVLATDPDHQHHIP